MEPAQPYVSDFQVGNWTAVSNLMQPRGMQGCASFVNSQGHQKVIVTGGTINGRIFSSTEIFDVKSLIWTAGPELPVPLYKHSMVTFDDKVYVIGGEAGDLGYQSLIYRMDCDSNSDLTTCAWKELKQKIQTPRCQFTAMLIPDELTSCHKQ